MEYKLRRSNCPKAAKAEGRQHNASHMDQHRTTDRAKYSRVLSASFFPTMAPNDANDLTRTAADAAPSPTCDDVVISRVFLIRHGVSLQRCFSSTAQITIFFGGRCSCLFPASWAVGSCYHVHVCCNVCTLVSSNEMHENNLNTTSRAFELAHSLDIHPPSLGPFRLCQRSLGTGSEEVWLSDLRPSPERSWPSSGQRDRRLPGEDHQRTQRHHRQLEHSHI